jgi:hypothetical protein
MPFINVTLIEGVFDADQKRERGLLAHRRVQPLIDHIKGQR